jgi:hypothetical protein
MIPPTQYSTLQIMRELELGLIRIPDFQRNPVWDANQVEILLDSILKDYPLGTFLLWKTGDKLKERNPLNLPARPETIEKKYLLDGQQRSVVLYSIFRNALKIRSGRQTVDYRAYFDLTKRTFNLYKKVDLSKGKIQLSVDQVPLDEAIVIDITGQSVDKSPALVRKLMTENKLEQFNSLDRLYQAFKGPIVGAIVVEGAGLESACEIFVRLNRLGTPLTVVDIMVAKTYSKTPYFNLREKLEEVNDNLADSFALNELTILESFSACLQKGVSEKDILRSGENNLLRDNWDSLSEALNRGIDFLKGRKIVPVSRFLPFDILLAPIAHFFYINPKANTSQLNELEKYFWRASASQRFIEGQNAKAAEDILSMDSIISGSKAPVFDYSFTKYTIRDQELRFGSSFCKTILCLYSTFTPRDFITNEIVPLDEAFATANARQIHHIFPVRYLKSLSSQADYKNKIQPYIDSVVNVCLMTALSNKLIADKKPSVYLPQLRNSELQITLQSHLVGTQSYQNLISDNFEAFLTSRADVIYDCLKTKIA